MPSARAGTFATDFNSGEPPHTRVLGTAMVDSTGGVDNTGALKLTEARRTNQTGSFVIDPLDGKTPVRSFQVNFKMFIGGGGGADGIGMCYLTKMPDHPFDFQQRGTGITVTFDTWKNADEDAPGVRVYSGKTVAASTMLPTLRNAHWTDVMIKLNPDGRLDLSWDGGLIFSNVFVGATNLVGQFGFGARTGSRTDNHWIDDLTISTQPLGGAFVESFEPSDNNASTSPMIKIGIRELSSKVDQKSIRLKLDGESVQPGIEAQKKLVLVSYQPTELFSPESSHQVEISYQSNGAARETNSFSFTFKVSSQIGVSK